MIVDKLIRLAQLRDAEVELSKSEYRNRLRVGHLWDEIKAERERLVGSLELTHGKR